MALPLLLSHGQAGCAQPRRYYKTNLKLVLQYLHFRSVFDNRLNLLAPAATLLTPTSPLCPAGHRIKSKDNRDKRVELLQVYARKHFPAVRFLDYAVTVEEYTLQKVGCRQAAVRTCRGCPHWWWDLPWTCWVAAPGHWQPAVHAAQAEQRCMHVCAPCLLSSHAAEALCGQGQIRRAL